MKGVDIFKLGYDMAKGVKGTGWMKFGKSELAEARENKVDGDVNFRDWAEGWLETLQWEHEVGKLLGKQVDASGDVNEDYFNKRDEWVDGYLKFMYEFDKKVK